MALYLGGAQNLSSVYIILFYYVVLRPLLAQQTSENSSSDVWMPRLSDPSSLLAPVIDYQCKD